MSRETSPYIVGDYWLDRRRDGRSPDTWQIATYSPTARSDVYRSCRTGDLELAKAKILAHVEGERAQRAQPADVAAVLPQLQLYWKEHASKARRPDTIAGSLRAFVGFLEQDRVGARATIADLNPALFARFREWRMEPHSFTVTWAGRAMPTTSAGVRGESVQRNLDDIRAALNHAVNNGRIPYAPKVPSVPSHQRSPARDVRVTIEQLGAMVAFAQAADSADAAKARDEKAFLRWILLMIATAARPDALLKFDPSAQWAGDLVDMHPPGAPRTKKRNPVVPAIRPLRMIFRRWGEPTPVRSRKTAWRTMRRALGLPPAVIPKTIRHTIATELRRRKVPPEQISGLLGHSAMSRITEVYAKYDPAYLAEARAVLTTIFREVLAARRRWLADHLRTKPGNGATTVIPRNSKEPEIS